MAADQHQSIFTGIRHYWREWLRENGRDQRYLAVVTKYSKTSVNLWLNGRVSVPLDAIVNFAIHEGIYLPALMAVMSEGVYSGKYRQHPQQVLMLRIAREMCGKGAKG